MLLCFSRFSIIFPQTELPFWLCFFIIFFLESKTHLSPELDNTSEKYLKVIPNSYFSILYAGVILKFHQIKFVIPFNITKRCIFSFASTRLDSFFLPIIFFLPTVSM